MPLAEIGGAPGSDDDLHRVSDVTRLSDGSVVVASSRPVFLRRYVRTDRWRPRWAGRGTAP